MGVAVTYRHGLTPTAAGRLVRNGALAAGLGVEAAAEMAAPPVALAVATKAAAEDTALQLPAQVGEVARKASGTRSN